jgi:ABC-type sugar transport system substrate-binding protein
VFGLFVNATVKSETLKFLATHPQKIDGVLQAGGMATGVMSAFEQAGRPMPIVQDVTMLKGSAGYWRQNRKTYLGAGMGFPVIDYAHHVAQVAGNMLAGDGVQFSDLLGNMPIVTDENLDAWSEPGWTLDTPGTVLGPPKDAYLTDAQTHAYFGK